VNNLNVYDPAALAGEAQNIRLFRRDTNIDYSYMLKRCLISVNGFYHLCDTNGRDGLMVIKAMDGQTLSGQLEIGLLSFSKVCQINCLPIQTDQIVENDQGRVSVDLKTDLTNKSVFMVFAGYMVFLDDLSFKQTGESKFTIDLNNMGLVNRYFEASKFIDLSAINTLKDAARPGRVDVASLTSIDNATAWMTLSQTFFVVCDTPQIYTQKNYLSTSSTVGIYYSYVQPTFPLCLETYRQPSYISFEEGNQWKIIVQDNIVENKLYDSINQAIWQNSRAHLLEIGKDIDA
jgi:hypothetical protein